MVRLAGLVFLAAVLGHITVGSRYGRHSALIGGFLDAIEIVRLRGLLEIVDLAFDVERSSDLTLSPNSRRVFSN